MSWIRCRKGHQHWGHRGAAGLLVVARGHVLLQLRSRHVQLGGTWSIPGGARERGESAQAAAFREAREETGLNPSAVEVVTEHAASCGGWIFTTVVATVPTLEPLPRSYGEETAALRWVAADDVETYPLHPGFAASWHAGLADLAEGLEEKS
ncbi:MutT/NUDIX family protein [Nocardioidaceae bacterium Broad-1]|nr:MutT/NUDIX family protein [Nocardioidaceae bacterium Broad-1]